MGSWIHGRIEWLRENGSWPLLVAIVVLATISTLLIGDEGVARPMTLLAMALLGVALVLGCLFAFPYAGVWRDDGAASQPATEAASAATPRDPAFINDIRTMLISIVVGRPDGQRQRRHPPRRRGQLEQAHRRRGCRPGRGLPGPGRVHQGQQEHTLEQGQAGVLGAVRRPGRQAPHREPAPDGRE